MPLDPLAPLGTPWVLDSPPALPPLLTPHGLLQGLMKAWHSLDDLRGPHEEGIGDASGNPRPADGIVSWLAVLGGTPAGGEGGATAVNNWLAGSML